MMKHLMGKYSITPLMQAAYQGDIAMVNYLLAIRAHDPHGVDYRGRTAIEGSKKSKSASAHKSEVSKLLNEASRQLEIEQMLATKDR